MLALPFCAGSTWWQHAALENPSTRAGRKCKAFDLIESSSIPDAFIIPFCCGQITHLHVTSIYSCGLSAIVSTGLSW